MKSPTDAAELPESWQPPPAPEVPDVVKAPTWDASDPAQLYAWFGPFGLWESWRKVVLSSCTEVIRAQHALAGGKPPTEARLDDLSRLHGAYLEFLADGLIGRTLYEREIIKQGRGG